jgi:DNA polymerase I-like protein with 3'-5' exonuclease and polymerase domains
LGYVDWAQQELGVVAALSEDGAMCEGYAGGDPYLAFGIRSGLIPKDATKDSHPEIRDLCKSTMLGIQYGMGSESLAARLNQSPAQGALLLRKHVEAYPKFWRWSDAAVDSAILQGKIESVFGWPLYTHSESNPRSLRNHPAQANGSELLRLACIFAVERGIQISWVIHDAVLIQAKLEDLDEHVHVMQECMRQASEIVLSGFQLRTEAEIVRYPSRYQTQRGLFMWETVQDILAEVTHGQGR